MPMTGFDDEFVDIVDYIIRITDRIWHERKIDLCRHYYAEDSIIHNLTGDIVGAATVEANTYATLDAFPDRTLDPDNVIWANHEAESYYTSHLITSRMTNEGASEFGPATGKRARIRTIADCICRENKIIEEWLVRDNAALVQQLGFDLAQVSKQQAANDLQSGQNLIEWHEGNRRRTLENSIISSGIHSPKPETEPEAFAQTLFHQLWNNKEDKLSDFYDFRVGAQLTADRDLYGTLEYKEYLTSFFNAVPDIKVSVDHVASIPYLKEAQDIAVRWSMVGAHTGDGLFGNASGAPVYILGASHWRVMNGRIREEWTVFDELAVRRQIETFRML